MKKCTIESAGDGWMIIWLGNVRLEASCVMSMMNDTTTLRGTIRTGPTELHGCAVEILTHDNENGSLCLAA